MQAPLAALFRELRDAIALSLQRHGCREHAEVLLPLARLRAEAVVSAARAPLIVEEPYAEEPAASSRSTSRSMSRSGGAAHATAHALRAAEAIRVTLVDDLGDGVQF